MKVRAALQSISPYIPGTSAPGGIKLSSNENPHGTAPAARAAMERTMSTAHVYPDPGATELRAAIARRHEIEPDRIIVGNGSDELMLLAAGAYLEPGHISISSEHTFSQYKSVTQLFDGVYTEVPMVEGRFQADAIAEKARTAGTRIVWLCNPNNPTGTILTGEEVRTVLNSVDDDVLVVLDEAYADYVDSPAYPDSRRLVDEYPNLIVLRTFSKLFGLAALRVGYGFGSADLIRGLYTIKQPFNVNAVAQAAAAAALSDSAFAEHSISANRSGREVLYRAFDELSLRYYRSHGNFVAVNVPRPAAEIASELLGRGVAVRALASFGLDDWLRVTVGTEDQVAFFVDAFRRTILDAAHDPAPDLKEQHAR